MIVRELIRSASQELTGFSATPNLDAELLLGWLFQWDRAQIILRGDSSLSEDDLLRFWDLIHERKRGKPVQYLIRAQEFMGLPFYVDERVLIPRSDTEILVEAVLKAMESVECAHVLDLCTGSGAIAVSLAVMRPKWALTGSDISPDALDVAKYNAEQNGVYEKIQFCEGNLFEAVGPMEPLDAIVSNPPYIERGVIDTLESNVRDYEPLLALDGGDDGLDFYRRIVKGASGLLKPGGLLALEIGYNQKESLMELLAQNGHYTGCQCIKDYGGHDRVILARKLG